MTQFISVPCKRGYKINCVDAISNYVKATYGDEQFTNHVSAFNDFNDMRNNMVKKLFDKHESTIDVFTRYYDQLTATEFKIPFGENGAKLDFKWDDAFGTESMFTRSTYLKLKSGGYERICVLFNIAAIYSQVAEIQNADDDRKLKNAVKYLQQAAGIFSYLRTETPIIIEGELPNDLNLDVLGALRIIMVAQAQELIYTKAVRDLMLEGNIAKIVQQVAFLYSEALNLMQIYSVKSIWPKDWIPLIGCKQAYFQALAEYYQAKACGVNNAFGEQIARLKKASELMKSASIRACPKCILQADQERIRKSLDKIEKENSVIYHDSIPEVSCLSPISRAVLARELPIDNPMNKDFIDLFDNILPLTLYSAGTMFKSKLKSLADLEVLKLKDASTSLEGILASLNLHAALMDTHDSDDVLTTMTMKAAALRRLGGVTKMDEMLNSLTEVMRKNDDLINEATRMLDEEEDADKNLRQQFKERWVRTPSPKLTESWRGEATKFNSILQQAKGSNAVILKTYKEHLPQIKILSKSDTDIEESIPKSSFTANSSEFSGDLKDDVRTLLEDVESMKKSRLILLEDLPVNVYSDLVSQFCKSLSEVGGLSQEQCAENRIRSMMAPLRERVRQSLDLQEQLMSNIREKCSHSGHSAGSGNDRVAVICSMMLAIEKYSELTCNLEEGLKFYNDCNAILSKFLNKVRDYCFARKTEKDELMKDLQGAIVSERTDINYPGSNFRTPGIGSRTSATVSDALYQPPTGAISQYPQNSGYHHRPPQNNPR